MVSLLHGIRIRNFNGPKSQSQGAQNKSHDHIPCHTWDLKIIGTTHSSESAANATRDFPNPSKGHQHNTAIVGY